jgi:Flp pilus assembly protein TadD
MAYAYFRAAIKADPAFVPAYSNLAFLYRQGGYAIQAERVLRYAMTLNEKSDLALRSLHAMLVMQGRSDEAAIYAKDIQARQEQDPYYWIGVGLDHFKQARYQAAIVALERAQSLTSGFVEVHRALAVAYFKQGAKIKVQEQVAALASIDDADPSLSALNQKLRSLH